MSKVDDGITEHCLIPQQPAEIVGCHEYWRELEKCKNKSQIIRVMARVLSSHGRHGNECPEKVRKMLKPYLEDFDENKLK